MVLLNNVANIIMGQSPESSSYNEEERGLPFYQGKAEFGENYPTPVKWCSKPGKIAEKGDVLISVRAPVGPTNICQERSCIGRGLAAVRPLGGMQSQYLRYWLSTRQRELEAKSTGTTFKAISGDTLRNLEINLPALPEQKRIVAKIERLFSRLDNAKDSLERVRVEIKRYRKSVLKSAFEGDYEENLLGDILSVKSGDGLVERKRNNRGEYYVYGGNGIAGHHDEFMFKEERLVIGRVGANCGNVHITKPYSWVTDNAFVVTFKKKINLKFMKFYIGNMNLNQYSGSSAQPVISGAKIYPIKIRIPEVEQQDNIVELIESRFDRVKVLEDTVEQGLEKIERLKQSILKKSFEGKLAESDPDDEPVEVLLERIKKEKAKLK